MTRPLSPTVMLLVAVLILISVTIPTFRFRDRNYHSDEVNTVHAGVMLDVVETAQWMAEGGIHPAGWRILGVYWVKLVGVTEGATRWLSALCAMLTLALVYRLGADLFDQRTGLYALFLLGTAPFALFYMREFRPYPALALLTTGLLLSFLRWMRRPRFSYALLFVLFGVAALQTHYFAAYILAGLALTFLVLVRWERGRYLRAFGLFAAIALSFTAWLLPVIRGLVSRGSRGYTLPTNWDTLAMVHDELQLAPPALGQLLLLVALLLPVGAYYADRRDDRIFRFGRGGRKGYVLLMPLFVLAIAFAINTWKVSITTRNLIVLLPPLAVLLAFALRRLPWQAQMAIVALIAFPALTDFRSYRPGAPYKETLAFIAPHYQPDDRFLVTGIHEPRPLAFYLFDRLPTRPDKRNMFFVGYPAYQLLRIEPFYNMIPTPEPEALAGFADSLADAQRLWYVYGNEDKDLIDPFLDILQTDFALYRIGLAIPDSIYHFRGFHEYRRIPDDLRDLAHFGESISLQGWNLPDGVTVRACQDVLFESWWQALDAPGVDLGIGLVLADASGQGVAKVDAEPSGARTIDWEAGTYHLDGRTLTVPCDLPPGDYPLLIGLHDLVSAEPLPAFTPDGAPTGSNLVYLTTLTVTP